MTDTRQARHTMACAEVSKGDSGERERERVRETGDIADECACDGSVVETARC